MQIQILNLYIINTTLDSINFVISILSYFYHISWMPRVVLEWLYICICSLSQTFVFKNCKLIKKANEKIKNFGQTV